MNDPIPKKDGTGHLAEFIVDANVTALNAALIERSIEPGRIIAILSIAPRTLVTITPERFRVLYVAS